MIALLPTLPFLPDCPDCFPLYSANPKQLEIRNWAEMKSTQHSAKIVFSPKSNNQEVNWLQKLVSPDFNPIEPTNHIFPKGEGRREVTNNHLYMFRHAATSTIPHRIREVYPVPSRRCAPDARWHCKTEPSVVLEGREKTTARSAHEQTRVAVHPSLRASRQVHPAFPPQNGGQRPHPPLQGSDIGRQKARGGGGGRGGGYYPNTCPSQRSPRGTEHFEVHHGNVFFALFSGPLCGPICAPLGALVVRHRPRRVRTMELSNITQIWPSTAFCERGQSDLLTPATSAKGRLRPRLKVQKRGSGIRVDCNCSLRAQRAPQGESPSTRPQLYEGPRHLPRPIKPSIPLPHHGDNSGHCPAAKGSEPMGSAIARTRDDHENWAGLP